MVDKKFSGFSAKSSAAFADLLPIFASCANFDLRADMTEISDIENSPFNKISPIIIIMTMNNIFRPTNVGIIYEL